MKGNKGRDDDNIVGLPMPDEDEELKAVSFHDLSMQEIGEDPHNDSNMPLDHRASTPNLAVSMSGEKLRSRKPNAPPSLNLANVKGRNIDSIIMQNAL